MKINKVKSACSLLFITLLAAIASGVALSSDPAAMPGFSGTTNFDFPSNGTVQLTSTVDYAVYAPGQYPGSTILGADKYIYAYQINNLNPSNIAIDFFSVGILPNIVVNQVDTDVDYGIAAGIDPAFTGIFAQSVGYVFLGDPLNSSQNSTVLLFSSSHAPADGFGTVSAGGISINGSLPTPQLPEPATLLLLSITAPCILRMKKR